MRAQHLKAKTVGADGACDSTAVVASTFCVVGAGRSADEGPDEGARICTNSEGECAAVEGIMMGAKGGGGGKSSAFEGSTIGTEGAGESASIVDSKMGIANAGKGSAIEGAAIGAIGVGSSVATEGKFNSSFLRKDMRACSAKDLA